MKYLAVFLMAALWLTAEPPDNPNIESFEYVWRTVRDKNWDPELSGINWQAVHNELRPKIEKAGDDIGQARQIMTEMLNRLHMSHYRIIPGTLYSGLGSGESRGDGTIGLDVRIIGGRAVVTSVEPDSPAAFRGVTPGWIVRAVDDEEIDSLIKTFLSQNPDSSFREITLRRAVLARLEGPIGEPVRVEFLDDHDLPVMKSFKRAEQHGKVTSVGYLGPAHVWLESKQLESGGAKIGYIAFNMFLDPANLMPQFQKAVESCMQCDGFIIDVRGNPGGLGGMAMGMAGWFVDQKDARLGTLYLRDTALKFVVNGRPQVYGGPLAILVDGASASTAEIFAGGMQDLKRARIFGNRTAGAALPSVVEKLPNGDAFQYAIANYVSEGGKTLEGAGVTPDQEAPWNLAALRVKRDPALDAAIDWIRSQKVKHE
jgi:carboxyl-terminal processing protease